METGLFSGGLNLNEIFNETMSTSVYQPSWSSLSLTERKKKILVVDDDQDFRISVCEILVEMGYRVSTAKDAEMALMHLIQVVELPDLILLDVIMPGQSGLEFRLDLLKFDAISNIPVLFVSGFKLDGEVESILKPIDKNHLMRKILELTSF
jgi:CheY-like chemotaxis protein